MNSQPSVDTTQGGPSRLTISFLAQVRCLCGSDLSAPTEKSDEVNAETTKQVARYQGHCVCGRVYFVSVVNTHGNS